MTGPLLRSDRPLAVAAVTASLRGDSSPQARAQLRTSAHPCRTARNPRCALPSLLRTADPPSPSTTSSPHHHDRRNSVPDRSNSHRRFRTTRKTRLARPAVSANDRTSQQQGPIIGPELSGNGAEISRTHELVALFPVVHVQSPRTIPAALLALSALSAHAPPRRLCSGLSFGPVRAAWPRTGTQ